jgi:hypothetical protein
VQRALVNNMFKVTRKWHMQVCVQAVTLGHNTQGNLDLPGYAALREPRAICAATRMYAHTSAPKTDISDSCRSAPQCARLLLLLNMPLASAWVKGCDKANLLAGNDSLQ